MPAKYLFLIVVIILIAALIINYSTNLFSGVKFDKEGNFLFEQKTEIGRPTIIPQLSQDYLAWQNFSKKDLLFVSFYQLKLNLGPEIAREISGLNFSFSLPGKIIKHNATRVEKNNAIWENIPQDGILILETQLIRWWLIILVLILGFFAFWLRKLKLK